MASYHRVVNVETPKQGGSDAAARHPRPALGIDRGLDERSPLLVCLRYWRCSTCQHHAMVIALSSRLYFVDGVLKSGTRDDSK